MLSKSSRLRPFTPHVLHRSWAWVFLQGSQLCIQGLTPRQGLFPPLLCGAAPCLLLREGVLGQSSPQGRGQVWETKGPGCDC